METAIKSSQPPFDPAQVNTVAMQNGAGIWLNDLRHYFWRRKTIRNTLLSLTALALMALPIAIGLLSKHAQGFHFSFLDFFTGTTSSNESPVLAVDTSGMTIRGKHITATAQKRFETAAVEQLAGLHQLYSGWTPSDQEAIGTMLLKLFVDGSGKVARIEPLKSQLSSDEFAKVVLGEMRQWNFPPSAAEPVEITIPLLFVPRGMDPSTIVQWERRTRVAERDGKNTPLPQTAPIAAIAAISTKVMPAAPAPKIAKSENALAEVVTIANTQPSAKPALIVLKATQAVTLRQQPRFAAEKVREIDAEAELNLLESKGDWLKVKVAETNAVGFIRKEFTMPMD